MSRNKCSALLAIDLASYAGWTLLKVHDGHSAVTAIAQDGTKIVFPNAQSSVNESVFTSWIRKIKRHGSIEVNEIDLQNFLVKMDYVSPAIQVLVKRAWLTKEQEAPAIEPAPTIARRVPFSDVVETIDYTDGTRVWACRYAGCDYMSVKSAHSVASHTRKHVLAAKRARQDAEGKVNSATDEGLTTTMTTQTPNEDHCFECGAYESQPHDPQCSKYVEPLEEKPTQYPDGMTFEEVWRMASPAGPDTASGEYKISQIIKIIFGDNDPQAEVAQWKARAERAEANLAALRDMLNEAVDTHAPITCGECGYEFTDLQEGCDLCSDKKVRR